MNIRQLLLSPMGATKYTANFDQGSGAIDAATGRITPVLHRDSKWNFWSIRHGRLGGTTPTYLIAKATKAFASYTNERLAVWAQAADTDVWTDFATVTVGASDISIQHNAAFPAGNIFIASQPLYPFSRTQRLVSTWMANALASDTTSGSGGIVGYETARDANDASGRTAPALPFYGFKISSGGANTKNKCILAAGNHPNETPGRFALEGAVNWLLTAETEQKFLLDWWDFYVYPCLNPQGVWAGYWSCNPEHATQHNDVTAGFDDLTALTTAMAADTSGGIDAGFDYHAYNANVPILAVVENAAATLNPIYRDAYKVYESSYYLEADTTAVLLSKWWTDTLGADLSINHENGMITTRSIAAYKSSGQYSMQALNKLQMQGRFTNGPGIGSRDFNGSTDRIDWANVANLSGSAVTISAWVYVDTYPGSSASEYIFGTHRSGDTAFALVVAMYHTDGAVTVFRSGTTLLVRTTTAAARNVPTGQWAHILVTHDGVITTYSSIHVYVNGVEFEYNDGSSTNGASEYAATGSWSLGGRKYDDARMFDGKIAQVGVWNRVLTSGEIANLAAGYAPDLAAASGLQFYFKGNTSSLTASPGGDGTADGTSSVTGAGNGPGIIYG